MPAERIQELLAEMEATVDERRELLAQDLDFAGLEQAITAQMNALGARAGEAGSRTAWSMRTMSSG